MCNATCVCTMFVSEQKMSRRTNGVSLVPAASSYFACVAEWLRLSLPTSNTWPSAFGLLTEDVIFQDFIFQERKTYLQLLFIFIEQRFVAIKYWKRKLCCCFSFYLPDITWQSVLYCQFTSYLWLIMKPWLSILLVLISHFNLLYLFNLSKLVFNLHQISVFKFHKLHRNWITG